MCRAVEQENRRLLWARDAMDRSYDEPLNIPALAATAYCSEAHFIRSFKRVFGETPGRYLQRRRIERAAFLLRTTDWPVIRICHAVGFTSAGTFGRTFRSILGMTPGECRSQGPLPAVPGCVTMAWSRPSSFGEAPRGSAS